MQATTLTRISEREILIARTFRAPPRIVYVVYTQAEHVKKWWAPRSLGTELVSCDADVRVGGKYRYVMRTPDAAELAFSGEYRELVAPERVVYTQVFEPMAAAGAALVTVTFEERAGTTLMTANELYPSKDALDMALASGMEHGMRETYEQLDELAATML